MREEVVTDLRALHAGAASATAVAHRMGGARSRSPRLWFAAALVQAEAVARTSGAGGPLALTGPVDLTKLGAWFSSANRARARLREPLRPELVVLEALSLADAGFGIRSTRDGGCRAAAA